MILAMPVMAVMALAAPVQSHARSVDYTVHAGFNLGGTSPMGLPAAIREINGFNPTVNLSVGVKASKMLTPHWGIGAGVGYEQKGMRTRVRVKNYHLTMDIERGEATGTRTGYFTGKIKNDTRIGYITVPVYAIFRPDSNWEIDLGPYFSAAVSRSFNGTVTDGTMRETPLEPALGVSRAQYDYSGDINRFDMGLTLAGSRRLYRGLGVHAALSWGVISTLRESTRKVDMDTYNVYLNVGLNYTF